MHVCFVVFALLFQYLAKRLAGKRSLKWPILCRVGRKTLTQSINQSNKHCVNLWWKCLLHCVPYKNNIVKIPSFYCFCGPRHGDLLDLCLVAPSVA